MAPPEDHRSAGAHAQGEGRADALRALFEQTPASLAGNGIGLVLIGLAFWPLADPPRLLGWLGAALLL